MAAASSAVPDAAGGAGAPAPAPAHTWRVDSVPAAFDDASWRLYVKYQMAVHGDAREECSRGQYTRFLCTSPLLREAHGAPIGSDALHAPTATGTVRSLLSADDADSDPDFWRSDVGGALRRCGEGVAAGWRDGEGAGAGLPLVQPSSSSGLANVSSSVSGSRLSPALPPPSYPGFKAGGNPDHIFPDMPGGSQHEAGSRSGGGANHLLAHGYGAFHHRYFLDGALVAVGVVDVLPHCLSSVYLFYDPDLTQKRRGDGDSESRGNGTPHLDMGKLTALREIQWVQDAARASPRLCHYYMGYYVHACPKMRYKAEYAPSQLRCPVTGTWVDLAAAVAKLDADPHAHLADAPQQDEGGAGSSSGSSSSARSAAVSDTGATPDQLAALIPATVLVVGEERRGRPGSGDLQMLLLGDPSGTPHERRVLGLALAQLFSRTGAALASRLVVRIQ